MKVYFPFIAAEMPEAESGKVSGPERMGNIYVGDISRYGMTASSLFPAVLFWRDTRLEKKKPDGLEKVRQAGGLLRLG